MECVLGIARLPLNGETTEEVYLAPGTGKPGVQLDSPILPPNCFLLKIDFSSFSCHLRPSPWKLFLLIETLIILIFTVAGGWSAWSSWEECDVQCLSLRSRKCDQGQIYPFFHFHTCSMFICKSFLNFLSLHLHGLSKYFNLSKSRLENHLLLQVNIIQFISERYGQNIIKYYPIK